MNIMIFDTETTARDFCYNVGYIIVNTDTGEQLIARDFVVEQVWHNLPLFSTAYYAEKRPLYVNAMRSRKATLDKFGYICQTMIRDIKAFNVSSAYAYNSPFDDKIFNINTDWYKCANPFDNIPIFDIRGYAINYIVNNDYKAFCDENNFYTDSGNYSTTAENMYRFLTKNVDFIENHTALSDSKIEWQILRAALDKGAILETNYPIDFKKIAKKRTNTLTIKVNRQTVATFLYNKKINKNDIVYLTYEE